ncbi:tyrosine-type recombinase/integrase [Pirellulales bacterium]|nr:tyrosine-type recombinase/integrase [Pirellulales bacterium]
MTVANQGVEQGDDGASGKLAPSVSAVVRRTEDVETEVARFLADAFSSIVGNPGVGAALIPWASDVLHSAHSLRGYGRDLRQFFSHMERLGVPPLEATADHVKLFKGALLKAGVQPATIARKLSVLRGAYRQFAEKELIAWETVQALCSIKAPRVAKNTTPALTEDQAISLLEAIPINSIRGQRDLALLQTFFSTGCRVTALVRAKIGDLEYDGVEYYLHVTEKQNKLARKILLDATQPLLNYLASAGIANDRDGPLFRPSTPNGCELVRREMNRKTPWRLVKKYCRRAGIDPNRLGGRGIGVHSLRKTAITNAIRNGAHMHEVREFAGHADIRTTELYYVRREEDAEVAARRIHIRKNDSRV